MNEEGDKECFQSRGAAPALGVKVRRLVPGLHGSFLLLESLKSVCLDRKLSRRVVVHNHTLSESLVKTLPHTYTLSVSDPLLRLLSCSVSYTGIFEASVELLSKSWQR